MRQYIIINLVGNTTQCNAWLGMAHGDLLDCMHAWGLLWVTITRSKRSYLVYIWLACSSSEQKPPLTCIIICCTYNTDPIHFTCLLQLPSVACSIYIYIYTSCCLIIILGGPTIEEPDTLDDPPCSTFLVKSYAPSFISRFFTSSHACACTHSFVLTHTPAPLLTSD